jgi:hypothetical protein
MTLRISDDGGNLVQEITNVRPQAGVNRVYWNFSYAGPEPIRQPGSEGRGGGFGGGGPPAAPGTYTATLLAGSHEMSGDFQLRGDPEVTSSQADYEARTATGLRGRDLQTRLNGMISTILDLRAQIESITEAMAGKELATEEGARSAARDALEQLQALEDELRRPPPRMGYRQYPRISEQLSFALRGATGSQARPTEGQIQVLGEVEASMDEKARELQAILDGPVTNLNVLLRGEARILIRR